MYRNGGQQSAHEIDSLLKFITEVLNDFVLYTRLNEGEQEAENGSPTVKMAVVCFSVLRILSTRVAGYILDMFNSTEDQNSCTVDIFNYSDSRFLIYLLKQFIHEA